MSRLVLPFAIAFSLALGARLAARSDPPAEAVVAPIAATHEAAPVARAEPAPPVPHEGDCAELQDAVLERLDAVQAEAERIERLRTLLAGEPVPWPDDVAPALREEGVRALFEEVAVAAGHELTLRELSCHEYPCIGIFEKGGENPMGMPRDPRYLSALLRELKPRVGAEVEVLSLDFWRGGSRYSQHAAIALVAPDADETVRRRARHRVEDVTYDQGPWP